MKISFPNLIKRDNEHDHLLAISKLMFSKSSVHPNWINNWTLKGTHIFWITQLFLLAFKSLASSWSGVTKDPRGNVQELLVHRECNKRWLFLQKSTCATRHSSTALRHRHLWTGNASAGVFPGGPRDQHWQAVVYGLRYPWNRLWWGWGAQGTTILHLEPMLQIFKEDLILRMILISLRSRYFAAQKSRLKNPALVVCWTKCFRFSAVLFQAQ